MDHQHFTTLRREPRAVRCHFVTGLLAATLLAGCSQSETPYVDMCQRIAGNLSTGAISNWDKVEKITSEENLRVVLAWSGDATGDATCTFEAEGSDKYAASPNAVVMNGEKVPFRKLLAAAAKSSGNIIGDAAEETAENTKKLASEATERAGELAEEAREVAGTAKERASELADQASQTAGELADKARDVAGEVGDKAREAALDATKAVQQKLEK
jgi:hypothetical protein